MTRIKINPKYEITISEEQPNEVYVRVDIDTEDWLRLSNEDKREGNNFHSELKTNIQKFLGVEFGSPAHGKLTMFGYSPNIMNSDEWIKIFLVNINFFNINFRIQLISLSDTELHLLILNTYCLDIANNCE